MLDQMFTAENFRRIFDVENRKGLDLVTRFFPHLNVMTEAVRDKVAEIRSLRASAQSMSAAAFETALQSLKSELSALKSTKSAAIDAEMEALSAAVAAPGFRLVLEKRMGPLGKDVFCVDGSPQTFFVVKQLQRNVNRIYGVKQANRHDLACQLRDTLASRFPFEMVRTDISTFYESIDRKHLYSKLDSDQLLSFASKKYMRQILDSYGALSSNQKGIPRGVGISAYLAELYLRPFDRAVASLPGVVLYCRYVDDIVAVFARPPSGSDVGSYKDMVLAALANVGLAHNHAKTVELDFRVAGAKTFEYLGYRFTKTGKSLAIAPSDAKLLKLEKRLRASFAAYHRTSHLDGRRSYRDIVARVRFLTGNARLVNSKSGATVGIYYNNPLVTDTSGFERIDQVLKAEVKAIKRPRLRARLTAFGFKRGFDERRFNNFSTRELQRIVWVWKHD